jgi:hypothetical protein
MAYSDACVRKKLGILLGGAEIGCDGYPGCKTAWHHAVGGNEGGLSRREIGQG